MCHYSSKWVTLFLRVYIFKSTIRIRIIRYHSRSDFFEDTTDAHNFEKFLNLLKMVTLHSFRFHFSSEIRNIFTLHNSRPPSEHDLLSPGLWEIFATYISTFQYISILPYYFSKTEKRLYFVRKSFVKRVVLAFSPIFSAIMISVVSVLLVQQLLSPNFEMRSDHHNRIDIIRTFVMFYVVFILLMFNPTSYVVAYRGEQVCLIINPIVEFQARLQGNVFFTIQNLVEFLSIHNLRLCNKYICWEFLNIFFPFYVIICSPHLFTKHANICRIANYFSIKTFHICYAVNHSFIKASNIFHAQLFINF